MERNKKLVIHASITMDTTAKAKLIFMAKKDSRNLTNYIGFILYEQIAKYERENGEIKL